VGRSQGTHSRGIGEQEDVAAAVSFIGDLAEVDSGRMGVAGYSAGIGYATLVVTKDDRVKALAAVSPPLTMFDFEALKNCLKPKFLISGGNDEYTPASQFLQFCQELAEPKECHRIEEAHHFWVGYEESLAEKVAGFFTRALNE
jgi:alpha/beta superfamily hydrolase